ncbi:RelA/SpoT family protein [Streptomyces sp. NPDC001380]|uniref:RelA/SpoT family protein n=1 Tax=Streptomyces sp. NPDC001380 TaxID=3364566 RepID=UPI003684498B
MTIRAGDPSADAHAPTTPPRQPPAQEPPTRQPPFREPARRQASPEAPPRPAPAERVAVQEPPGRAAAAAVPRTVRRLGRAALGRAGRAALLATGRPPLPDAIEPIVRAHRAHHPRADLALLGRAYLSAEAGHRGQTRKSGEPYITHPLAVTMILAQLGAETTTLVAALLHDTVEDTEMTLDQVRADFGEEVAYLVDGVTKLEKVDFGAAAEAETFRKMLLATGNDVRVMVIKLADRLHNMRTIRHMKPASRVRIAKVTRDVLIPLAERLGIQVVKTELEDIVFATLHPEEHGRTAALVAAADTSTGPLADLAARLRRQLAETGVAAEVTVRPRHCVSVHRVLLKRLAAPGADGRPQQLRPADLGRVLVVVEENADCYAALGELHTCWTPLPGEFKDFVAAPKFNLYQSLHTAVADERGDVVEVLVRTRRMHRVAEFGVVALGSPRQPEPQGPGGGPEGDRPAEDGPAGSAASAPPASGPDADGPEAPGRTEPDRDELDRTDPARPGWLTRLLDWQRDTPDPDTFWSTLTADLSDDREITAVTEEGATLTLRAGATCVDAAYALGEQVGHRCIGARVNGRLAALSTQLGDGDVVGVLTEPGPGEPSGPSPEWLRHVRTPRARLAIEHWLAAHPVPAAEDPAAGPAAEGPAPAADGGPPPAAPARGADRDGRDGGAGAAAPTAGPVEVRGRPDVPVRLARCCTPVPPDRVTGFAIRGGTVAVHRRDCPAGRQMRAAGRTPVEVGWTSGPRRRGYRVTLLADALNRPRLLADLTAAIAAEGVGIVSAAVEPPQELRVRHTYTVELPDPAALAPLMRAMLRVSGVYDVYRPGPGGTRRRANAGDPAAPGVRPSSGIRGAAAAFTRSAE